MNEIGSWMALVEELKGIREELKGIRELMAGQCFIGHKQIDGEEDCDTCLYISKSAYDLPCRNCCLAHDTDTSFYERKE